MGMLENLRRLSMTGDPDIAHSEDLTAFVAETAHWFSRDYDPDIDTTSWATALALGIQYGIAYAAEFGIPDIAKNLFTVKEK